MKILLLTSKLNFKTAGGSVMDLHLKAKGLVDLGHEVTVVTAFSRANIIEEPLPYSVIEETTTFRGLLGIQYHGYNILKKHAHRADVIYIDGQIFIYAGGLYRMFGGKIPVVPFFNTRLNCMGDTSGNANSNPSLARKIKKVIRFMIEHRLGVPIANHCDWFIFNTPHVQEIYRTFGYRTERSTIIEDFVDMRGTIDVHKITAKSVAQRQQDKKIITLFSTGRMLPEKGFDIIVRGFAMISNKERYHVILSGDGPDKKRIEDMIREMGLEQYFTLPGWVSKETLAEYFLTSQVFIFPKWWIEYGSALLTEALAFGLPCIIPAGGALEWLTEGKMKMFKNDSPEEMAGAIQDLGEDEMLRIMIAQNSLARADTLDAGILNKRFAQLLSRVGKQAK
jgi:glycosyltransferase involved in cell wall biosynthesis